MDAETRVKDHFAESIATKQAAVAEISQAVVNGGQLMSQSPDR